MCCSPTSTRDARKRQFKKPPDRLVVCAVCGFRRHATTGGGCLERSGKQKSGPDTGKWKVAVIEGIVDPDRPGLGIPSYWIAGRKLSMEELLPVPSSQKSSVAGAVHVDGMLFRAMFPR